METEQHSAAEILKVLKIDYFKQVSLAEEIVVYSIFFILVAFAIMHLRNYLQKEKDKKTSLLKNDYQEKEKLAFQTLVANLELTPHEYHLLKKISGSSTFRDNYAIIESIRKFEAHVSHFKQTEALAKELPQVLNLRHKLGFHYNNSKVPFVCTQMLMMKTTLECSVQVGHKQILFISPVANISEQYFYLKPPTSKRRPVSLEQFPSILCKARRKDGTYEFKAPLVKQVYGENPLLVLSHTSDVKKIIEREYERIPVKLPTRLYQLSDRHLHLNRRELHQLKEDRQFPSLGGIITNISQGGMHFITSSPQGTFWEQDIVMFEIPGISARDELQAQILSITSEQGRHRLHLQFFHLTDLEHLKLHKLILRLKEIADSPVHEKADSSTNQVEA
ncbi:MAG: PilZ domain-containing protein [SAR324 cluster bacterium]|nr:PilZ domain-containing protein [SAR324 cluster bacterium]